MDFLELVKDFGALAAVALIAAAWFYDRGKSETKTESAVTEIALDSTEQAFKKADQAIEQGNQIVELFRQLGDVRQDLGRAQGQNIELTRNFEVSEAKREEMKTKLLEMDATMKTQQSTIARHSERIIELEGETKRKDELIVLKESRIVELETKNAELEAAIQAKTDEITSLNLRLEILSPPKSLDETIPIPEIPPNLVTPVAPDTVANTTSDTPVIPSENQSL